ncbi:MAG: PorV/PorQ family protein [Elusimicrobia bacterium]|nr:PorV/PorQ family protein [Elusimicrobiota bacterium]
MKLYRVMAQFSCSVSLILCCCPFGYGAQSSAAQFLKLGFGARALGMGESFVAVADDISSVYYNPAGLALKGGAKEKEFLFSHAWHIQDMGISQLGFTKRPYGFALTYFSAGEIEGMDSNQTPTGNFTAEDLAFSAGYGFDVNALHLGVNGRYIHQRIKSSAASAVCSDFGALYHFDGTPYWAGASVSNLGTKIKFVDESFPLPLIYRLGAAADFKGQKLLLALEADFPNDSGAAIRAGAEYRGVDNVAFRLGYKTGSSSDRDAILGRELGSSSSGVSSLYGFYAGVGFNYRSFALDYAFLPYGELGNSHRFSVGVKFQ